MQALNDEKQLLILELVSASEQPLGSWNLVEKLEEKGINLSPATIGRILNHLERHQYLAKKKFKGRVITPKGEAAIQQAQQAREMAGYRETLETYINSNLVHHYIMVLEARKAIERTTARLAARNISDTEISRLEEILKEQEKSHQEACSIAQTDIDFHHTIAAASQNKVLEALYVLISLMGQQSELFEYIRKKVGAPYMVSHRQILEALRRRDPEGAEEAMIQHMDALCRDVNSYWHEYYGQG